MGRAEGGCEGLRVRREGLESDGLRVRREGPESKGPAPFESAVSEGSSSVSALELAGAGVSVSSKYANLRLRGGTIGAGVNLDSGGGGPAGSGFVFLSNTDEVEGTLLLAVAIGGVSFAFNGCGCRKWLDVNVYQTLRYVYMKRTFGRARGGGGVPLGSFFLRRDGPKYTEVMIPSTSLSLSSTRWRIEPCAALETITSQATWRLQDLSSAISQVATRGMR